MSYFINALKNYANFKGRTSRKDYWMYVVSYFVVVFLVSFVDVLIFDGPMITGFVSLALLIPTIAIQVRRLHDSNKSGWFVLASLIPFGGLLLLYFFCIKGTDGPNRFDTSKVA